MKWGYVLVSYLVRDRSLDFVGRKKENKCSARKNHYITGLLNLVAERNLPPLLKNSGLSPFI
jgi:hypothetical protein